MIMAPFASLARSRGLVPMPSIWPLIVRLKSPESMAKTWNLTLDEPALTTRIVSTIPSLHLAAGIDRRPAVKLIARLQAGVLIQINFAVLRRCHLFDTSVFLGRHMPA